MARCACYRAFTTALGLMLDELLRDSLEGANHRCGALRFLLGLRVFATSYPAENFLRHRRGLLLRQLGSGTERHAAMLIVELVLNDVGLVAVAGSETEAGGDPGDFLHLRSLL